MRGRQEKGKRWKLEIRRGRIRESSNTGPRYVRTPNVPSPYSSNGGGGRSNHGKWSTRGRGGGSKGAGFNDESKFSWFPKRGAKSLVAFFFLSPPLFAFSGEGNVQNEVPHSPPRRLLSRSVSFKNGGSKKEGGGRSLPPLRLLHVVTMSQLLSRPLLLLSSHTRFK